MDKCTLVKPDISYKNEIESFKKEMLEAEEVMPGTLGLRGMEIEEWLEHLKTLEEEKEKEISEEFLYVRESDQKIVGMIRFSHSLNSLVLKEYAGHIGYSIRPSERRKGYATRMLSQVLNICRREGVYEIMISCNSSNYGSRKVILKNGGVYEKTIYLEKEKSDVEIYWIDLENPYHTVWFCVCKDSENNRIIVDDKAYTTVEEAVKRYRKLRKDKKRWIIYHIKVESIARQK